MELSIPLEDAWVQSVTFSPTYNFMASSGHKNTVSIHKLTNGDHPKFTENAISTNIAVLKEHNEYVSCIRYVDDDNMLLSASGDGSCILWDIETEKSVQIFSDHTGEVMWIDINKDNHNLFVSCSMDSSVKIWDFRTNQKPIGMFDGHTADVNCVKWFPGGYAFVSGSDDGDLSFFDIKAYRQLNVYIHTDNKDIDSNYDDPVRVTSVAVSLSGAYIYGSYDNGDVFMWSTLKNDRYLYNMKHCDRVSSIAVSPNGYALGTACWDCKMRIFA